MRGAGFLGRFVLAGAVAGVVAAVVAGVAGAILQAVVGRSYVELSAVPIAVASLVTCVVGGVVYYALSRWTRWPVAIFAAIALVVATLDTVFVTLNPPHPGFAVIANPLHYVVAVVAAVLIPLLSARGAGRGGE